MNSLVRKKGVEKNKSNSSKSRVHGVELFDREYKNISTVDYDKLSELDVDRVTIKRDGVSDKKYYKKKISIGSTLVNRRIDEEIDEYIKIMPIVDDKFINSYYDIYDNKIKFFRSTGIGELYSYEELYSMLLLDADVKEYIESNGGRLYKSKEYWRVAFGYGNGSYQLHRWVVERYLGRALNKDEFIHHIDLNVDNNKLDNLLITTNSEHIKMFHPDNTVIASNSKDYIMIDVICDCCGKTFKMSNVKADRLKKKYCSKDCRSNSELTSSIVAIPCAECGRFTYRQRHIVNYKLRKNKDHKFYCCNKCSGAGLAKRKKQLEANRPPKVKKIKPKEYVNTNCYICGNIIKVEKNKFYWNLKNDPSHRYVCNSICRRQCRLDTKNKIERNGFAIKEIDPVVSLNTIIEDDTSINVFSNFNIDTYDPFGGE